MATPGKPSYQQSAAHRVQKQHPRQATKEIKDNQLRAAGLTAEQERQLKEIKRYDDVNRRSRENKTFFIYRNQYDDPIETGYNYVFFTAPELTLSSFGLQGTSTTIREIAEFNSDFLKLPAPGKDSIYTQDMVKNLTGENGTFIRMLTNRSRSYPAASETLETIDYAETWNNYKILLGTTSKGSKVAGSFEMSFMEDSQLTISKFFHLWKSYIEGVWYGDVISKYAAIVDKTSNILSATGGLAIDYAASMYHFALSPDAQTIRYYAKYTGIFPTSSPWEIFQGQDGDAQIHHDVPVSFAFSYKEVMNPAILRDFNLLTGATSGATDLVSALMSPKGNNYPENSVNIGYVNRDSEIGVISEPGRNGETVYKLMIKEDLPTGVETNLYVPPRSPIAAQ